VAELSSTQKDSIVDCSAIDPLEKAPPGAAHTLGHRSLKRLIDFLFLPSTHVMPNERVFAETLLLRDWDALSEAVLERLAERLANTVETAPRLALRLARCGRFNISGPLLKFGDLHDIDLVEIAHKCEQPEQLNIASRRNLSPLVSDLLVDIGAEDIVKAVLMNTGSKISTRTLSDLITRAKDNITLQNAILFRPEIAAADALELFWHVPGQMREYILLTYLCDQRSLNGFLYEDDAWQEHQKTLCSADISDERLTALAKLLVSDKQDRAIEQLVSNARLSPQTAARILNDKGGEAFLVTAKAIGASRAGVNEALLRFINAKPCIIGSRERLDSLRNLFDRLSRDQALVALQYWSCKIDESS